MANYMFAVVGKTDIEFKDLDLKDNLSEYSNSQPPNLRKCGENLLGLITNPNFEWTLLDFPIFNAAIKYFKENEISIDEFFVVVSDGPKLNPEYIQDTINYGKVLCKYANSIGLKSELIISEGFASDFDDQYERFMKEFKKLKNNFNYNSDVVYVYVQVGSPAMRNAILLNCLLLFNKTIQLSHPRERGKVEEQHFPTRFREQVRKSVTPFALKETLATISARNLSHTDGSHVMISYANQLKSELENQLKSISEDFTNTLNTFQNYNDYLRGQMEYIADLSGQTSGNVLFDYNFKEEIDRLKNNMIDLFLGSGLIDNLHLGTKLVKVEIDRNEECNKIVAIPGGANGINAFYTIMKNFIRNLYKHSKATPNELTNSPEFKLYIKLEVEEGDYYKVIIHDGTSYETDTLSKIINGTDNGKGIKQCMDDTLMSDAGTPRSYGWGIIEMKIAAFYLMGLPLSYFDYPLSDDNMLVIKDAETDKTFPKPFNVANHNNHLTYEFYLKKPSMFMVVANSIPSNENIKEFKEKGIQFISGSLSDINSGLTEKFLLLTGEKTESNLIKFNNIRVIDFYNDQINNLLRNENQNNIIKEWLRKTFTNGEPFSKDYSLINLNLKSGEQLTNQRSDCLKVKNLIVIDNHAYGHPNCCFDDLKNYFYYSTNHSKDYCDVKPLNQSFDGKVDELRWEELEAIFTKVVVLDERLQFRMHGEKNYIHKLSKRDLLELRGIFVPKPDQEDEIHFDLQNLITTKNVEKLELILKDFLSKYDYVVLHFSILEMMANVRSSKIQEYYDRIIHSKSVETNYLVLTSGKGTPSTLPTGSYFINLTTLEKTLNNLSKVQLVQHLNALRKFKNRSI